MLRLAPQHISLYLFEIDEKSRLGREVLQSGTRYHAPAVPGEEFMADAYQMGREVLAREGYIQYEISNFARPGYESRHNLKYWQLAPYIGIGAGAHSFDGIKRWANEDNTKLYIDELARIARLLRGSADSRRKSRFRNFSSSDYGRWKVLALSWHGNDGARTC